MNIFRFTASMALLMAATFAGHAQLNLKDLGNKAKNAIQGTSASAPAQGKQAKSSSSPYLNNGKTWYVSTSGSNKNDGLSAASPLKNLQKAIDNAENGDVVLVAEGNYLGTLGVGYIEIKDKYISVVGGFNADFTERNPVQHRTTIQTGPEHVEKNGSKPLIRIDAAGQRQGTILIDGFGLDLGLQNLYAAPDPDERNGWPEGCETGRIQAVGEGLGSNGQVGGKTQGHPLMQGNVEGHLVVRNCVFANGGYYGLQMMNKGGDWEIYNNVFVANSYAACQVDSMNKDANVTTVDFHHNTVLFTWCRTKIMEDMGYGFRFMSRVDCNVHENIFGCSNLGALDYTHHDSNKQIDAMRKIKINNNRFFMNRGDLILPSASYTWLYIKADEFDDVEEFEELDGNEEITDPGFLQAISQPYLAGFAQIKTMASSSFNPNSAANQFRQAHGLNMQGSETVRVSMYGNRYPFAEAYKLFGALEGFGAGMDF
ncbi:MAG: hypothetical protein J5871_04570 [Bacteroidales bacterium]|nr:hypothetical protein [Bacteroidales bacterium]